MSKLLENPGGAVVASMIITTLWPQPAASQADDRGALNIVIENDRFAAADDNYTNGFQIDYLSRPRRQGSTVEFLLDWLPGNRGGEARFGWLLGQRIFTPADTDSPGLLPDQRPYAAWLYAGLSAVYSTDTHIDSWTLNVGTVGPDALGEEIQNGVHDAINSDNAVGWDNQIPNELGATLIIERKWQAFELSNMAGFGMDVLPHVGVSLGNIEQYANAGFTFRLGDDLDSDFGPPRIRPSLPGTGFFVPKDRWVWYLFLGVDGRYVDKNIFIDDNRIADRFNIVKEDWVGDAQVGLVVSRGDLRVSYTHVYRTEQFDRQNGPDRFGSLAISWRF
jgi:lipid A 3-O-deacylase